MTPKEFNEIIQKLDIIEKKLNTNRISYWNRFIDIFGKLLIPASVLILSIIIHKTGTRISSEQSKYNLEIKYAELFYEDITSNDSIKQGKAIALLSLMNKETGRKFSKWAQREIALSNSNRIKVESKIAELKVDNTDEIELDKLTTSYIIRLCYTGQTAPLKDDIILKIRKSGFSGKIVPIPVEKIDALGLSIKCSNKQEELISKLINRRFSILKFEEDFKILKIKSNSDNSITVTLN